MIVALSETLGITGARALLTTLIAWGLYVLIIWPFYFTAYNQVFPSFVPPPLGLSLRLSP
jgi:hypothetical protein